MSRTGKFFRCLSKKGMKTQEVEQFFTIGQVYAGASADFMGENESDEETFLLFSDPVTTDGYGVALYVSAMDFDELKQTDIIYLN